MQMFYPGLGAHAPLPPPPRAPNKYGMQTDKYGHEPKPIRGLVADALDDRRARAALAGSALAGTLNPDPASPARLEARLEELRRRNNNAGDAMEESDDDESMDGAGYAGPEVFGPGRRLDSTETAPDPAPALAAAQEAETRRAAQEEARRKDVADKRAAFLARLSP